MVEHQHIHISNQCKHPCLHTIATCYCNRTIASNSNIAINRNSNISISTCYSNSTIATSYSNSAIKSNSNENGTSNSAYYS